MYEYYNIDKFGVIRTNGKFKGQLYYVPYFLYMGDTGCSDKTEKPSETEVFYSFDLTCEDRGRFPELEKYSSLIISDLNNEISSRLCSR